MEAHPLYGRVIFWICYIVIGILPYVYSAVVKKWPIRFKTLFSSLLFYCLGILFLKFHSIILFYLIYSVAVRSIHATKLVVYSPKSRHPLDEIVTKIQDIVNRPPYYIAPGCCYNKAPKYFSWEPIYEPIRLSKQKITAIFVDYKLATNDPNISLRQKENIQKDMEKWNCFVFIPEGCSAPMWAKHSILICAITLIASIIGLGGIFEIPLYSIDVKHFKLRKMLSTDPKAHKYNSISVAHEQAVIVED